MTGNVEPLYRQGFALVDISTVNITSGKPPQLEIWGEILKYY